MGLAAVYGGAAVLCPTVSPIPPPALHSATIPSPPNRSQNAHLVPPASGVWGGGTDQGWNGCSRLPYEAGEGIARGVGQWGRDYFASEPGITISRS
jgi:hypothetical protein